ncbi:MAG TPA: conjugal transfer protein TraC [Ktedonobacteraceae bacterium]|nr:conjugal transfer protein TraC [Ktedonobacteraceae bacterium]
MATSIRNSRRASVQHHFVHAREILNEVVCLYAPLSPTKRTYCTILDISTMNFLLKSSDEQDALVERYRSLLKSLTFPVQIVVRNQPLDVRPYLAQVQAQIPVAQEEQKEASALHEADDDASFVWADLATGLETFLQQVGNRRTLVERHCYLIVPAPDPVVSSRRFAFRKKRRVRQEEIMTRCLQELSLRCDMIQQQLALLGLRTRRVMGEDLARLYQSFLTPGRAYTHPLRRANLASVGHLPRVTRASSSQTPVFSADRAFDRSPSALLATRSEEARLPALRRQRPTRDPQPGKTPGSVVPPADFLRLADLLAPASIVEKHDFLQIENDYVRGLAVIAFPREVAAGWLAPLLMVDELVEISFHLHPQPQAAMMRMLKRRRVGYASARKLNQKQGRLDDPDASVAQNDVSRLMSELASGDERLFELSFQLVLRAPSKAALDERTDRIMALLQTIFLDAVAHPVTFEHAQAFRSFLPECHDELGRTITLDTASVATTFPFMSNSLVMPGGAFLGLTATGEPVLLNPWNTALENPHAFVGGVTGGGKSYLGKLWLERSLLVNGTNGERYAVIDPDGEYLRLANALGGTIVRLAPGSAAHLNPFDLIPSGCDLPTYQTSVQHSDRLAEKIQDLHSLLDLMLADAGTTLSAREKALLDRALYETYRRASISADPQTHFHQPPLLRDLAEVLRSGVCGPDEYDLGMRLSRYTEGSLAGLFSEQTNVDLDTHLLVWDTRDMRGDMRPVGIFLIADAIWTQAIYQSHIRRCLSIDEAASLIEHPEGGRFLANLSRRARKRYLRLVIMTQSPESFVEDQYGSIVASNAAIKILKKQDRTSINAVTARFGLTSGEEQRLLLFGVQEALLFAGDRRVLLSVQASPQEHLLITTNPVELAEQAAPLVDAPAPTPNASRRTTKEVH